MAILQKAGVGQQAQKRLRINRVSRYDHLATISQPYANGTVVADFRVGPYTYHSIGITLSSATTIAGKTFAADDRHHVNTANIAEYVERVVLKVNGAAVRDLAMGDLIALNTLSGVNAEPGFVWLTFPDPSEFDDREERDAYALGTSNARDVRVELKLTPAWNAALSVQMPAQYAKQAKQVAWLKTATEFRRTFATAGAQVIQDLPTDSDLAGILVIASDQMNRVKLEIDGEVVHDLTMQEMRAFNAFHGRDMSGFPANTAFFDFFAEGAAGDAIRSMKGSEAAKRNADIRIRMELQNAGTEIRTIILGAGRWRF